MPEAQTPEFQGVRAIFQPLERVETVPERVAGILRRAILGDELAVGEKLPSEKALASQFETNRVSLRQALQILKASGLIEGGQGKAWRVADFRRRGGLDWLPELFEVQGFTEETLAIIEDFLRVRTPVLRQILAAASRRMKASQREALSQAMAHLEEVVAAKSSIEAVFAADLAWFEALLQASNSLLYRSVYQPFADVYRRFARAIVTVWRPIQGYPAQLREIHDALLGEELDEALAQLTTYLEAETERLQGLLQGQAT